MSRFCAYEGCTNELKTGYRYCSKACAAADRIGTREHHHSDKQVALFKALWEAGVAYGEIAERTGIGRNSLASLRRRLKLIPRGNPVGRGTEAPKPRTMERHRRDERRRQEREVYQAPSFAERPPLPPQIEIPAEPPPVPVPPFHRARDERCPFVLNDGKPWRMCDAPLEDGARFCAEHKKIMFLRAVA